MEVTILTWAVALAGLLLIGLLAALQVVAVLRPRERWTIENVYGGMWPAFGILEGVYCFVRLLD